MIRNLNRSYVVRLQKKIYSGNIKWQFNWFNRFGTNTVRLSFKIRSSFIAYWRRIRHRKNILFEGIEHWLTFCLRMPVRLMRCEAPLSRVEKASSSGNARVALAYYPIGCRSNCHVQEEDECQDQGGGSLFVALGHHPAFELRFSATPCQVEDVCPVIWIMSRDEVIYAAVERLIYSSD